MISRVLIIQCQYYVSSCYVVLLFVYVYLVLFNFLKIIFQILRCNCLKPTDMELMYMENQPHIFAHTYTYVCTHIIEKVLWIFYG